jgi:hypothetical protein
MGYDISWDKPHRPGDQELWQESDAYWFYDAKKGVGGFHRIGQQPNRGKGQLTLFIFKEGGKRFVMSSGDKTEVDLGPKARQESKQVVGNHSAEPLGDGRMRYIFAEEGCSGDLEFYESFYEPRSWWKSAENETFMSTINSDGHLECSGKIRGRITIGGKTVKIEALAHRDRSWGFRDNSRAAMYRYRMFSGTVGPELSFAGFLLDIKDGPKMMGGFALMDGAEFQVTDLRVLTTFDYDGFTPIGAIGILTLDNSEKLRIETKSVQGFMTPVPSTTNASQDHISTFVYKGKTGFLDLELCTNPGRGTYIPVQEDVTFTAIDQGLSEFVAYEG